MKCVKPISVHGMSVACGRCVGCRIARTEMWTIRMRHESSYWKDSAFVTLTYDEDHLPDGGTLTKRDPQLFLKRFRKDTGRYLKYYLAGEYGDLNGRPHYHAVMFGVGVEDRQDIEDAWRMGRVQCTDLTIERIRYTAKYIQYKTLGRESKVVYGERLPPFQVCSQGIGKRWLADNGAKVERMLYITVKGRKVPIPRYYKERLGLTAEDYSEFLSDHDMDSELDAHGIDIMELAEYRERQRRQYAEELAWLERNKSKLRVCD